MDYIGVYGFWGFTGSGFRGLRFEGFRGLGVM